MNADERETVVNATDGDEVVRVWTAQRRFITQLRHNPKFVQVDSGFYGTTEWAQFEIPAAEWSPATGAKRRVNLTDEQKAAAAARLAAARGSLSGSDVQHRSEPRDELDQTHTIPA